MVSACITRTAAQGTICQMKLNPPSNFGAIVGMANGLSVRCGIIGGRSVQGSIWGSAIPTESRTLDSLQTWSSDSWLSDRIRRC